MQVWFNSEGTSGKTMSKERWRPGADAWLVVLGGLGSSRILASTQERHGCRGADQSGGNAISRDWRVCLSIASLGWLKVQ